MNLFIRWASVLLGFMALGLMNCATGPEARMILAAFILVLAILHASTYIKDLP